MPTWDASGAGYGAIGGATSVVVAPLMRDRLYDGNQTVKTVDNGDGTRTVTTSYDNQAYNAATAAVVMLEVGHWRERLVGIRRQRRAQLRTRH